MHPSRRLVQLLSSLDVDLVLDVGAADGSTGLSLRRNGYAGALHSFEPLPGQFERLSRVSDRDDGWRASQVALSDTNGSATFNLAEDNDSSSLLKATTRGVVVERKSRQVEELVVQTSRLDDMAPEVFVGASRAFMKIDTQGSELRVIDGAVDSLRRVVGVLVEVSFYELYERGPLAADVIAALTDAGFVLRGFVRGFSDPTTGQQLQADVIMTR